MNFAFIGKKLRSPSWPARPRDARHGLGRRGERAAARHLKRKRHRILARNFRCPAGEIDLISEDGDTIVFVEVKTRASDVASDPQEALRARQLRRLEGAARYYLMQRSAQDRPCRFDVITVVWAPKGRPRVEHFEDAFQPRRA